MKILLIAAILACTPPPVSGQRSLRALVENDHFTWTVDTTKPHLWVYLEKGSYPEQFKPTIVEKIQTHIESTCIFMEIQEYEKEIHYFVVESRAKMALLLGYETNGGANYKQNYVTALYSESTNSVFSNHELFHLMAMNAWGKTEAWFNEGMAVYSDNGWHGQDLHVLSNYLVNNNQYISLKHLSRKLRTYDSMIAYPLLGSFAKFLDRTYGRETTMLLWKKGRKKIKISIGKNLDALELEWLEMLASIPYQELDYMK